MSAPSFTDVFQAAWGHAPYPWQVRLAERVAGGAPWPAAIGAPTGAGKTAALDVALYALAAQAHLPPEARTAPRRVVMVVDRRTIVDQSFERTLALREALLRATDGPLAWMAARLRALMGPEADLEEPLAVAILRGGVPGDDGWARRPDQALIAVSTVDQVGSRLLFRGYGVRPTMAPVHAGLLGHDTLLLLDEVHLSRPFDETLSAIGGRYRGWRDVPLPDRWQVVRLSATQGAADNLLTLGPDDLAHPALRRRLHARKPLRCVSVDSHTHAGKPPTPAKAWVKGLVDATRGLLNEGRRSVGLVVNRVDTARALQAALTPHADTLLITGRMRPCDRDAVMSEVHRRCGPGWSARALEGQRPVVCVATQTIEAGADLDFDGLVTELASLDALVQRFGRANRTGDHDEAPCVVVAPRSPEKLDDPVYGAAPGAAWAWLQAHPDADLSTAWLGQHLGEAPAEAFSAPPHAAVLLPGHLDLLSQTSPIPRPDPDPGLFLHGTAPPRPEVRLVWRADAPALDDASAIEAYADRLAVLGPTTWESLALPFAAARRWLSSLRAKTRDDLSYSDTLLDDVDEPPPPSGRPVALRWRDGALTPVAARGRRDAPELRPGDVLILPSTLGGVAVNDAGMVFGFDPDARAPVPDRGDLATTLRTGRPTLRLDARVWGTRDEHGVPRWPGSPPPKLPDGELRPLRVARQELLTWARGLADDPALPDGLRRIARELRGATAQVLDGAWVLTGRPIPRARLLALARDADATSADGALTADDRSAFTGAAVPLDVHLADVARWAEGLATATGLPPAVAHDVALAAAWHDLGKADPRFQVLLHGGDDLAAADGPVLAKSGMAPSDVGARRRARARSGLPGGFRHELMSVALLTADAPDHALLARANDPDLVLHLVGAHHGYCRPFAPVEDHRGAAAARPRVEVDGVTLSAPGDHGLDALDSGVAERFWRVQRRYGWWGLAWIEAVLRLADHRASEAEARAPRSEEGA